MLKVILKIILNIVIVIILFLLQLYVFNDMYIFGVRFDAISVYCIVFALFYAAKISIPISLVIGFCTDMILCGGKLKYAFIYIVAVLVIEGLKTIYRQDSSKAIIIYATTVLAVIQLLSFVFNCIEMGVAINIFTFVFFVIKMILLNLPLAFVMYIVMAKMNRNLGM